MPSWKALVKRLSSLIKRVVSAYVHKCLKGGGVEMLEKSRECFARVNICNVPKSSQNRVNIKFLIIQRVKS